MRGLPPPLDIEPTESARVVDIEGDPTLLDFAERIGEAILGIVAGGLSFYSSISFIGGSSLTV